MSTKHNAFLLKAINIVADNIDNIDFNATDFSQQMHLSRSQLHRKLKNFTGRSATDFIRHQRLITARQLLIQKKVRVTEVAYQVGFNNLSYFSKCFKEKYGCTPSKYFEK